MKKNLIVILIIILVGAGAFLLRNNILQPSKIPTDWITYKGDDFQFSCPKTFGANVWKATTRPPVVTVVPANEDALALGCPLLKNSGIPLNKTEGKNYTLYTGSDIGAGSLYTSMCYIFSGKTQSYVLDFEIRSHSGCGDGNCGAYCGTQFEQECKNFDMEKDVIAPIKTIISTYKIKP